MTEQPQGIIRPVALNSFELASVFDRRAGELEAAVDQLLGRPRHSQPLSVATGARLAIAEEFRMIAHYLRRQPFGPPRELT